MKRDIKWHETCKFKCSLDTSVCNNKQRWNNGKCRYECKELIDNGICDKGFIWNLSNFESEWDKSYDVEEYSDFDKLVEECKWNYRGRWIKFKNLFITELWVQSHWMQLCWMIKKCIQVLNNIHSVICHWFFNNHWNSFVFTGT